MRVSNRFIAVWKFNYTVIHGGFRGCTSSKRTIQSFVENLVYSLCPQNLYIGILKQFKQNEFRVLSPGR